MSWSEVALGELIELKRGFDLPAPDRRPGAVPVVSSRGVIARHEVARVQGPGVVTGRTGTLGGVYFVAEDFWPLNTTLYVRDFKGNDPRFVAYLLGTIDFHRHNDKAAIPGVSPAQIHELRVRRPPPREQRSIARELALLDRRHTLLVRLDRHLDALATALFRCLPPGRTRRTETLCTAIGNGTTPPRREPGTIPWIRSGELADGPLAEFERRISADSGCRTWPRGTVLVALYAAPTVGRMGLLTGEAAVNQACCALVARPEYGGAFLFHALLETRDRLARLASGAAQQNINQRIVREHELRIPAARTARAFHERAQRLHDLRAVHTRERTLLREIRDLRLRQRLVG